ncbi:hypothetical protein [Furfurilactobacillus siliginis]|uniref:Uncharacterized protein n=1 Tax=Furfurilactobacillus siliginis TaxID=348151 RepID=A0A0R2LDF4_9LACO|nr:hypothetical protein [Furfurilactobacillus siliginis]KRN96631.1 hypothetical protein IV55_GL001157 [Furfurilactobacillus siliginis]GEK28802.1 hypothetical protein LSI01_11130 [Furfurilactobacillus siliginis]
MITIFHSELGRHSIHFSKGKYITFNLVHPAPTAAYRIEITDTNIEGLKRMQVRFSHLGQIFKPQEHQLSFQLI